MEKLLLKLLEPLLIKAVEKFIRELRENPEKREELRGEYKRLEDQALKASSREETRNVSKQIYNLLSQNRS